MFKQMVQGVLEMTTSGTTVFTVGDPYNPVSIYPSGNTTFDVAVSEGLLDNPGSAVTKHAVGLTWTVKPVGSSPSVKLPHSGMLVSNFPYSHCPQHALLLKLLHLPAPGPELL